MISLLQNYQPRRDMLMTDLKSPAFTRRQAAGLLTAGLIGAAAPRGAFAQTSYLDIRRGGNFNPIPIAVTNFAGDQGPALSGIVTIISPARFSCSRWSRARSRSRSSIPTRRRRWMRGA